MLRFWVTTRFVAAAGRHELLGGGVVGGGAEGGGVGAVGAGLEFSPLAQAPASIASIPSSTIDRSPTRITDTLLSRNRRNGRTRSKTVKCNATLWSGTYDFEVN